MRAGKTEWVPTGLIAVCFAVSLTSSDSRPWRPLTPGYGDAAEVAQAFLESLDDAARTRAVFPFDGEERFDWHFVPRERKGLPPEAMTPDQRRAAHALLQRVLRSQGNRKAPRAGPWGRAVGAPTDSTRASRGASVPP